MYQEKENPKNTHAQMIDRAEKNCETGSTLQAGDMAVSDFGWALRYLWRGEKIFRRNWNGKGMYLAMQFPDRHSKMSAPYIYIRTADNCLMPWVASQSDLLGSDWEVFK